MDRELVALRFRSMDIDLATLGLRVRGSTTGGLSWEHGPPFRYRAMTTGTDDGKQLALEVGQIGPWDGPLPAVASAEWLPGEADDLYLVAARRACSHDELEYGAESRLLLSGDLPLIAAATLLSDSSVGECAVFIVPSFGLSGTRIELERIGALWDQWMVIVAPDIEEIDDASRGS